jgi:hypothetical protein
MSVINASAPVVVTDRSHETNDSRCANEPPAPGEPGAVDHYIADVLRRAHQTAEVGHRPDEARAILHVAELFAEDLAKTDPQFDRLRFIQVITRDRGAA